MDIIQIVNVFVRMFIDMYAFIVTILQHPNTPAYIQAGAVIIATVAGMNYLSRRKAERKFDLVISTYKHCLEAADVLVGLKQVPPLLMNRESIEVYENLNKINLADIVADYAASYLDTLNKEQDIFDNLYNGYAEMRLFYSKNQKVAQPIENLLWARNRISILLNNLKNGKWLIQSLVPAKQEEVMKIIRNAMVQIWENIELTDWQKEYEERVEEVDGVKGVRKFYYLNDLINKAKSDIDEKFPELIAK